MFNNITIRQLEQGHPFQKYIDLQQTEWSSAPSISSAHSLFLQSNGVYRVSEIMQKKMILTYVLKLKEFNLQPCHHPSPCKWQHNENQLIPGVQTANCLWGSWGHPMIRRLFRMPERNCEGGKQLKCWVLVPKPRFIRISILVFYMIPPWFTFILTPNPRVRGKLKIRISNPKGQIREHLGSYYSIYAKLQSNQQPLPKNLAN